MLRLITSKKKLGIMKMLRDFIVPNIIFCKVLHAIYIYVYINHIMPRFSIYIYLYIYYVMWILCEKIFLNCVILQTQ